jgi:hypothetical protein
MKQARNRDGKLIHIVESVEGEFYTCPVFNEAIGDGKQIYTSTVNKMWGIGTPEDLQNYLRETHD